MNSALRSINYGLALLALAAAAGLALSLFNYFLSLGIGYTYGALLVICSTFLILVASLLISWGGLPGWLRVLFVVLLFLGIVGTGFAAWFLDGLGLIILMGCALVGWLAALIIGLPPRPAAQPAFRGAAP
jgi:hypothetical protein